MARVPQKVQARFARELRKYNRILQDALDRDINEADTAQLVADMLSNLFGFDRYAEVTAEYAIKATYCDLAVKKDGEIAFLLEVKAIGRDLKEHHLRQAVDYGVHQGIQYVVLTNAVTWEIYKITFERPVQYELICAIDMRAVSPRRQDDQEKLFLLCREGIAKAAMRDYHQHVQAVNRFVIAAVLQSDSVVAVIRREVRRLAPKVHVEDHEILQILQEDVLKREVIEGGKADEARQRVRKAASRTLRQSRDEEAI
jgi:predicted type IV restriction endonuclease